MRDILGGLMVRAQLTGQELESTRAELCLLLGKTLEKALDSTDYRLFRLWIL